MRNVCVVESHVRITRVFYQCEVYLQITKYEKTQSSCKRDTKSKSHLGMKLAPVRVFSCKHPLTYCDLLLLSYWRITKKMYLLRRLSSFHSHLNFTEEHKYNNLCFVCFAETSIGASLYPPTHVHYAWVTRWRIWIPTIQNYAVHLQPTGINNFV